MKVHNKLHEKLSISPYHQIWTWDLYGTQAQNFTASFFLKVNKSFVTYYLSTLLVKMTRSCTNFVENLLKCFQRIQTGFSFGIISLFKLLLSYLMLNTGISDQVASLECPFLHPYFVIISGLQNVLRKLVKYWKNCLSRGRKM